MLWLTQTLRSVGPAGIACWLSTGLVIETSRVRVLAEAAGVFFFFFFLQSELSMLTLIRWPFHCMLLQWHVEDPGHSAKSARVAGYT